MSNNTPLPVPLPGDADAEPDATREVDGEETLDQDVDPDLIDSAEADRLAAEGGDAE